MDCPWSSFQPANLRFCEEPLCAVVTEPANTWSNVGFFVAGWWILRLAKRAQRRDAGWLGWVAIATGAGSVAFHATSTLAGQLVDQNAMFLESSWFVALNAARSWGLSRTGRLRLYAIWALISFSLLFALPTWGIGLFVAHVLVFLGLELRLFLRDRATTNYRPLLLVGLSFVASWGLWWLDKLGLVCDPQNHVLNGHALWHLLGALSFVFWYQHYAQFEFK